MGRLKEGFTLCSIKIQLIQAGILVRVGGLGKHTFETADIP